MAIISKQKIKLIKLFLVSPTLEKIFLFVYVLVVPFLAVSSKYGNNFSSYSLGKNLLNIINEKEINSITTTENLANWITNTLSPSYFTNKITINKPLFPIFIFKSDISTENCDGLTFSDIEPSCSFLTDNLLPQYIEIEHNKAFYGVYKISNYLKIQRSNTISDLAALNARLKTSWFNKTTTFVSVQSIYYNAWDKGEVQFKVDFELNYGGTISATRIAYNISYPVFVKGPVFVILYTLFVIQLIVFTFKVLFEFSIVPNKYTFMGHVVHFAVQYAYVFVCAVVFQENKAASEYSESFLDYKSADSALEDIMTSNMIIGLVLIFYPFRLFTFLALDKYFSVPIKMIIVLYRTLPGVILVAFSFIVLWVCYSLASFMGLRGHFFQIRSYGSSFLNYFSMRFGDLETDGIVFERSGKVLFNLTWAIGSFILGIMILFTLVILIDLVKRSFAHEIPASLPHQLELLNKQAELYIKFEKFLKELNLTLGAKNKGNRDPNALNSQDKMVIWLEHNMGGDSEVDEVIEQLNGEQIKIMVFYKPEEVEEFLKYLFRLKPNLLTSQSGSRFRLVFETKFERGRQEKNNIEILLDWLKGVGCRVPFLLFTKAELERDTYIPLKKKYPSFYATEEKNGALMFCRMEGRLENLNFKLESNENKYVVLDNTDSDISMDITNRTMD